METRRILLSDSIGNYNSDNNLCNFVKNGTNRHAYGTDKEKYRPEESTSNCNISCSTECIKHRSRGEHDIFSNGSLTKLSLHSSFIDRIDRNKTMFCCQTTNNKTFADKTTFCRPVFRTYNREFFYSKNKNNNNLPAIVRKLAEVRKKEKQKEAWNNYINKLKHKHSVSIRTSNLSDINKEKQVNTDMKDDNTKYVSKKSGPCSHLLRDIYSTQNYSQPCYNYPSLTLSGKYNNIRPLFRTESQYLFGNNQLCFPTSSQGRLFMMQRNFDSSQLPHGKCHTNAIHVSKKRSKGEITRNKRRFYGKSHEQRNISDEWDEIYDDELKSMEDKEREDYLREVEECLCKGAILKKKQEKLLKMRENKRNRKIKKHVNRDEEEQSNFDYEIGNVEELKQADDESKEVTTQPDPIVKLECKLDKLRYSSLTN